MVNLLNLTALAALVNINSPPFFFAARDFSPIANSSTHTIEAMATTTPTLRSTIETTVRNLIASYKAATRQQNVSLLSTGVAEDAIHIVGPRAYLPGPVLNPGPEYRLTKQQYEGYWSVGLPFVRNKNTEIKRLVVDAETKTASAHLVFSDEFVTADGKIVEDGGIKGMELELVIFLKMSEDGTEVKEMLEFCDAVGDPVHQGRVKELAKRAAGASSGANAATSQTA
ncbi:hypothetical protein QBC35DRAFT_83646 [Podospora australis]|uniref:SnoaL-like domain-containing protein n=1 Tax=Podospora australis TaxID=1536484 RepID=A0AAN6WLI6_9PEZI|nr:hypothetical protein QBC35DRAFT_83646 [Podospora australis]